MEGKITIGQVRARKEAEMTNRQNILVDKGKITPQAVDFARKTATSFMPRLPVFQGAVAQSKGQPHGGSNRFHFDISLMPRM